mgnify:CR=1 FL=1
MFIVSRYRAPWVAFAFIAVVSIGAFMRFQQSAMNSTVLFELFRCGVRSINEAGYCNKIGEDFFKQLSDEQKTAIRPIFNKYFSNRPVR